MFCTTGVARYLPQSISTRQMGKESVNYGPFHEKGRCQGISRFLLNMLISTFLKLAGRFGSIPKTAVYYYQRSRKIVSETRKKIVSSRLRSALQQGQLTPWQFVI
jgi:hypothetical protein